MSERPRMTIPESHLAQEAIAALVDGELSGGAAGRAARHLTGCAQCRMAVTAQREAKAALQVPEDVAVPGDLMSRLRAIPFTAEMPSGPTAGGATGGADGLVGTAADGAWAMPPAPVPASGRPAQHRWLRRGMTGALAGIGIGVVVLASGLPAGNTPADDVPPPGPVAGPVPAVPGERTEIVPPVVRTVNVGARTGLPGGTP
ncbi:anti-sigma factor family protein [Modestobacter sp. URMC 112]